MNWQMCLSLSVFLLYTLGHVECAEDIWEHASMPDITVENVLKQLERNDKKNASYLATLVDNFQYLVSPGLVSNNTKCRKDSERYWNEILKGYDGELWAIKMLDSDGSLPPFSYFFKNDENLGKFGECIESESEDENINDRVTAQYCTYFHEYDEKVAAQDHGGNPDKWAARFLARTIVRYSPTNFRGMCVPASCSRDDIQKGLSLFLNPMGILPQVREHSCATKPPSEYSAGQKIMLSILFVLFTCIIAATAYDIHLRNIEEERMKLEEEKKSEEKKSGERKTEEKKEKRRIEEEGEREEDLFLALVPWFSIVSNTERLMTVKKGDMDFLNGIKFWSRVWVTLGFGHVLLMESMHYNAENVYKEVFRWHNNLILACKLGIDSFFFVSAFLTTYTFLKNLKGNYRQDNLVPTAIKGYLYRYIRQAPTYAFFIALFSVFYFYMGDGPIWKLNIEPEVEKCQKYWHENLFFFNGIIDGPESSKCIQPTWYLSIDMIYSLFVPIFVAILLYDDVLGVVLLLSLFISSFGLTIVFKYVAYAPTLILNYITPISPDDFLLTFLRKSAPYVAGTLCGFLCFKNPKERLSEGFVGAAWAFTYVGVIFLAFAGFQVLHLEDTSVSHVYDIYTLLHRPAWCVLLFWIVFACSQGYGDPLLPLLGWGAYYTPSKMMYSVFLVSYPVQAWLFYSKKKVPFYDDTLMNFTSITQIVLVLIFGAIFYVLVECPFSGTARYFMDKMFKPKPKVKTG